MENWIGSKQYKKCSTLIVMIFMIAYDFVFFIKISLISVLLKNQCTIKK